jgi:membrane-bound serine protease (ClpP class)
VNERLRTVTKTLHESLPACVAVLVILTLAVSFVGSQSSFSVYVIRVNSNIDQGTADMLQRGLQAAQDTRAEAVVIQLNTNGGLLSSTETIVDAMTATEKAGIKVIVYVGPQGARAFSAGAFIAMASDYIAMDNGTVIGSSTPILGSIDPSERAKITNGLASWMQTLAELHSRNSTLARLFVTQGISQTSQEAIRFGIAEGAASSPEDALRNVHVVSSSIGYIDGDMRSALLSFLSDPTVVTLLAALGGLLILLDLFHPTVIATALGVSLVGLALYGLEILELEPLEAVLLIVGVATILLELKKGHGLLAVTGVGLTLLASALIINREPYLPKSPQGLAPAFVLGATALVGAGILGFYLHQIREVLARRPAVHDLKLLIGKSGVTKTDLPPGGTGVVLIASDTWNASADELVKAGESVVVTGIDGLKVHVRRS